MEEKTRKTVLSQELEEMCRLIVVDYETRKPLRKLVILTVIAAVVVASLKAYMIYSLAVIDLATRVVLGSSLVLGGALVVSGILACLFTWVHAFACRQLLKSHDSKKEASS